MNYLHLIAALVSIAALTVLRWVLVILPGFFLVPLAILFKQPGRSVTGYPVMNAPRWLWLWGNDQDGLCADWYHTDHMNRPWWLNAYIWSAWRNPANNLRFVRWLNPSYKVKQALSLYIIGDRVTILRYKWFYRVMILFPKRFLLAGWKFPMPGDDYLPWQDYGLGFGIRLKRYL